MPSHPTPPFLFPLQVKTWVLKHGHMHDDDLNLSQEDLPLRATVSAAYKKPAFATSAEQADEDEDEEDPMQVCILYEPNCRWDRRVCNVHQAHVCLGRLTYFVTSLLSTGG